MEAGWVQMYLDIPVITRTYVTACLITTLASNLELVSQLDLYLNLSLVTGRWQIWRLVTTFLFSGSSNFSTLFNLLFTYRYSRILEETSFHRRASDYCFMFVFLAVMILILSLIFTNMVFLGHTLTHALLYIWCRRNPAHQVIIMGFMTFYAHYVPFVLIGFSILTGHPLAADIISVAAGHTYYFLEDIFPRQRGGFKILKTPRFLKVYFNEEIEMTEDNPQIVPQGNQDGNGNRLEENNNIIIRRDENNNNIPRPIRDENNNIIEDQMVPDPNEAFHHVGGEDEQLPL